MNPMDSLASFMPNQDGFQSIASYFQEDSLSLPSFPPSMTHPQTTATQEHPMSPVKEEFEEISMEDINPQVEGSHNQQFEDLTFPPSDPPPPYNEHDQASPYFSKSFMPPTKQGPISSSTPVTENPTLRH